jgi:GNAT superfamily N-acetyltransferase
MVTHLPSATLKLDETLTILRVPAPCGDWADRIVDFMYVKHIEYANSTWHRDCERAVAGEYVGVSNDVFFLGLLEGEIVATCYYGTPSDTCDLATFGRVVTAAQHRRKGISAALCAAAIEDFRASGGWCMHLGTTLTNPARFIYENLGFRHYNFVENHGTIMRLVLRGDYDSFEEEYFRPGLQTELRALNAGDLARAELLYNLPHWFVKDYSLAIYANTPYEGEFYQLRHSVAAGEVGLVLQTVAKRLVGMAYTARANAGADVQGHLRVLEFLVHPNYSSDAPELIATAAATSRASRLLAYSSAVDASRCEALEEAGFIQEATLSNCLQDSQSEFDLYIYSLHK